MYEIKKIEILSIAKAGACFGLALGLIPFLFGLIAFLTSLFLPGFGQGFLNSSFLILFIFPVIFIVMGFIEGLIVGLIYNLIASKIGGIEMEIVLKEREKD